MLISNEMNAAINQQIGREFCSSLQYVAIAAYFDAEHLTELAAHFFQQADEERIHAMRFVRYVLAAGGQVDIPTIPAVRGRFANTEEAVRAALEGEITVTREINALVDLSARENDHITHTALQWFVTEQLEEVSSMETLLSVVQRAGEGGLLHVEEYLARRRPQPPSTAVEAAG